MRYSRWALKPTVPKSILEQINLPIIESTILFNRGIVSQNDSDNYITTHDDKLHETYPNFPQFS